MCWERATALSPLTFPSNPSLTRRARSFGITFEDVTARKQAEWDLQTQRNELVAVNRLLTETMAALQQRNQELDQFAYVASHDLKAPLRAIANLATWLEEDIGERLPAENQQQLALLQGRVQRMEGLINGLLAYARVGRAQQPLEQVDVGALLREIVDSLAVDAKSAFEVVIGPDMPVFQAKRTLSSQVFANLISNALKHHDRDDGQIQVAVQTIGDHYEFSVTDDGPGIAPEYHDKIFNIFQTLKARDSFESTGIGLSIVKKTVEAEGGQIKVESRKGQGATFRFTWPCS
jgi:signal transduction histidine kinase